MSSDDANSDLLVRLEAVSARLPGEAGLKGIHWTIRRGEAWAVLAPQAAGKTLLGFLLAGEMAPDSGEALHAWEQVANSRHAVAYVGLRDHQALLNDAEGYYQARFESIGSHLGPTVREFLSPRCIAEINPFEVLPARSQRPRFPLNRREVLQSLRIQPLSNRRLHQLSNGEQRRVLLARALLRRPTLLILDDPFLGLDVRTRVDLGSILQRLMRGAASFVLLVRRAEEIPPNLHRVLKLERGRLLPWNHQPRGDPTRPLPTASDPRKPAHVPGELARRDATRTFGSSAPDIILQLTNVTVRHGRTACLRAVDWTIRRAEHWAVLGPNGAGKSTLLSLILGDHPQAYSADLVLFGRRPGAGLSRWEWMAALGFVSPELLLHQPAGETALNVVCSGYVDTLGLHQRVAPSRRIRARHLLRLCGVASPAATPFGELPAAEQRLALVARALAKQPRLLILDEPCQGLGTTQRQRLVDQLDAIAASGHSQLIVVTHHPEEIPTCVGHVLRMRRGRASATER